MLACRCGRAVERSLAFAPIEAREVAARERRPHNTIQIEIDAARAVSLIGRYVHFGQSRLRRVWTRHEAQDIARLVHAREADIHRLAPDRIVNRTRLNTVKSGHHAFILRRIERLICFDVGIAFAVAVRINNERRPTLRLHFVAGLLV